MDTNLKILAIGTDRKLPSEVQAAFSGLTDVHALVQAAADYRHGAEALRARRPDLALVEMSRDLRGFKAMVEEVGVTSPETAVVAVFHQDAFGPEVSEGAIIIEALRAGVQDFLRRPLSSSDLDQLLARLNRRAAPQRARNGKVVTFFSNKGGVGKSTLSVNVTCGLARRHPGRVLLVDASLQMGVCAAMLDLAPHTTVTDAVRQRGRLDERLIRELATPHACGAHLLACPNDAVEAAEVDDEIIARVLTLARRSYDYVVVDTFPMMDRVMTAILDLTDVVYVVTESTVPVLRGGAKLMELLDQLGYPRDRRRVVLNRYSNFAGNLKSSDVGAHLGRTVDHVVPYEKKLLIAANLGRPFVLDAGRFSTFRKAISGLIADVESRRDPSPPAAKAVAATDARHGGKAVELPPPSRRALDGGTAPQHVAAATSKGTP